MLAMKRAVKQVQIWTACSVLTAFFHLKERRDYGHITDVFVHTAVLLSSSLTALCPNTAVLFAFVWVGAVEMVLELFMEAVLQRSRGAESERESDGERNARWECLFWSSFLRGAAVRLLACGDKPSDPHRSPSLPPPLLWLSAIRRSSCNWMTIFLSRSFQKIARGWKCVWCGR